MSQRLATLEPGHSEVCDKDPGFGEDLVLLTDSIRSFNGIWAAGEGPAVRGTINGHTYRSTVASMGGKFMLGASAANRESAGVPAAACVKSEREQPCK